jgi:hypothetical protein
MSTATLTRPARALEGDEEHCGDLGGSSAFESLESFGHEDEKATLRDSFNVLADELEEAAAGLSSTRRALRYPAFVEILALGDSVVPEVIERLRISENRPLWLRVLGTLTPFPPGAGASTIDEAADAWIRWGRLAR